MKTTQLMSVQEIQCLTMRIELMCLQAIQCPTNDILVKTGQIVVDDQDQPITDGRTVSYKQLVKVRQYATLDGLWLFCMLD